MAVDWNDPYLVSCTSPTLFHRAPQVSTRFEHPYPPITVVPTLAPYLPLVHGSEILQI